MVWHGGDGGVLEDGAVVPEPPQLRVDLVERSGHEDLLELRLGRLEAEGLVALPLQVRGQGRRGSQLLALLLLARHQSLGIDGKRAV